jgi:hypothetical protein
MKMRKAFRASRLMGLFALVCGLISVDATAAHAELNAHWNVNGAATTAALKAQLQATLENNDGILLTKVGLSKEEILCTSIKLVNMFLTTLGATAPGGKIHFEGCISKLNGVLAPACVPHSPGAANGLIETNALKTLIKLHEPSAGAKKVPVVEVLPEIGTVYVTIILGKSSPEKNECAVGEKFDLTGSGGGGFFVRDCQNEGEVEKVTHLAEEEKTLTKLLIGASPMTLDGSANVFLAGAHSGLKFSAIPG